MENILNRCIVLVLLLRIANIVEICQVLVQVLGAAGLVKVKGATACTSRPSFRDDTAKGFIGVSISIKTVINPATFGTMVVGGARALLGTSARVSDIVTGNRWRKRGRRWAGRGFVVLSQCLFY